MKFAFKDILACLAAGLVGVVIANTVYDKKKISLLEKQNAQLKDLIGTYEVDMQEHVEDLEELNKAFDRILFSNKEEA